MKKGLNALEMIFSLFVLIVVVLVVIRLFISRMTLDQIEGPVGDIRDTYNYESERSRCQILCSNYEATCNDYDAISFCTEEVKIDIDGDKNIGEKKQGGVIAGIPFCEDGLYCFRVIENCGCGTSALDAKGCLDILCDYYTEKWGYTGDKAMKRIRKDVPWGTCTWDPNQWNWKSMGGYEPDEMDYSYPDPDNPGTTLDRDVVGADYWWYRGGYFCSKCEDLSLCWGGAASGLSLSNCKLGSSPWNVTCGISGTCSPFAFSVRNSTGSSVLSAATRTNDEIQSVNADLQTLKVTVPDTWTATVNCWEGTSTSTTFTVS